MFHFMVDPNVMAVVELNPEESVILVSVHEFQSLCTIVQNHVEAIVPLSAIRPCQLHVGEAPVPDGGVCPDPYRVPDGPSQVPVSGMQQGIEGHSSPEGPRERPAA
jgi:hypothetical protein